MRREETPPLKGATGRRGPPPGFPRLVTMKEVGAAAPHPTPFSLFTHPSLHHSPTSAFCLRIRCLRPQAEKPRVRRTRGDGRAHPQNPL